MIARRAFAYWRRRSWKRAVFRAETEAGFHRRKKRQLYRRSLAERFNVVQGPSSSLTVPIIASVYTDIPFYGDFGDWPSGPGDLWESPPYELMGWLRGSSVGSGGLR